MCPQNLRIYVLKVGQTDDEPSGLNIEKKLASNIQLIYYYDQLLKFEQHPQRIP